MVYGTILLLGILKKMGLAASQARLLSLTSRQHTIEHKAQFLQAQKIRLANDSDAVYEKYINALDATKLETRTYDSKGKVHWVDGSLSNLLRYSADDKSAGNVYYVQNIKDGKLYMPKNIVEKYNDNSSNVYKFVEAMGVNVYDAYSEDYINAKNKLDSDINLGWNEKPFPNDADMQTYMELSSKVTYPDYSAAYNSAQQINNLVTYSKNGTGTAYLPWNKDQFDLLKNSLNSLKSDPAYHEEPAVVKLAEYCNSFDVPDVFNNPDTINTLTATPSDSKVYYISYDRTKEEEKENPEARQSIGDIFKLRMLLTGGTYLINGNEAATSKSEYLYAMYITPSEANTNDDDILSIAEFEAYHKIVHYVYSEDMRNYLEGTFGANINIGDALGTITQNIMNKERDKAVQAAETALNNFLSSKGTDQATIQTRIRNYQQYNKDLLDFNLQSPVTYKAYSDSVLGKYYENMFNAIQNAGGCIELADEHVKSSSWVNNMIKNAQVVLAVYNNEKEELDNVTASSNGGIREVSNDAEIIKIDSEYETALDAITAKETRYNTELNQLEAERNAIQTEMESLKKIAKENIESTFKLFT